MRVALTVAAALTLGSHIPPSGKSLAPLPAPTPIQSPATGTAGMPQLTAGDAGVLLSWVERDGAVATLKFAERTPGGWTPVRTAASGADWFVNWADVPSVLRLDGRHLAAHWLQKSGPDTYAYDVSLAFTGDNGATWSAPTTPHHDGTKTEHGFASLFRDPSGLGLIWLDGRAMTPGDHGHAGGAMTLRAARFDLGGRQIDESLVDDRVCECCPTSAAVTAEGPLVVYRNRADGEIRDIYASRRLDGSWSSPAPVFDDRWEFPACPVNGPAAAASGRDVVVAWFTVRDGQGHAYVSFSSDAGRTFGAPVRLDDEASLGRVDVELLDDRSAVAAWIEYADDRAEWRMRRVAPGGARSAATPIARVSAGRSSGYPRLARHGRELVLAWTDVEGEHTAVRTAIVPTP